MTELKLGATDLGGVAPCFIIAEVGLAHDGSLGAAHAYIDAAAQAGADAIKFQTHIASAESTPEEKFRVNVFPQDETRYSYWERTAFTEMQWRSLKEHAVEKGIEFLSTPFSIDAVKLLRRIGVKGWKIGSGETNNLMLLEEIAAGGEPVLLSSGMSYLEEVDRSLELLLRKNVPVVLFQCTNKYPCPPESWGLNLIQEYRERYNVPIGYSDHSGEIASGIAAVSLGAKALEVHVAWSKSCFGPDTKASLTFEQLQVLVKGIRLIERAFVSPVDKNAMAEQMQEMRHSFTKGLVAKNKMAVGHVLTVEDLDAKKPCLGISVAEYQNVIGKSVNRNILQNEAITWDDVVK